MSPHLVPVLSAPTRGSPASTFLSCAMEPAQPTSLISPLNGLLITNAAHASVSRTSCRHELRTLQLVSGWVNSVKAVEPCPCWFGSTLPIRVYRSHDHRPRAKHTLTVHQTLSGVIAPSASMLNIGSSVVPIVSQAGRFPFEGKGSILDLYRELFSWLSSTYLRWGT